MSHKQRNLWPGEVATDPIQVANIYNKASPTYGIDIMKDGWNSTFAMLNSELQNLFSTPKGNQNLKTYSMCEKPVVLDAGCGDGLLADHFEFKKHNTCLYGIDIAYGMLSIAKSKKKYDYLKIASLVEKLPFPDEYFDVVVANGELGYCANNAPIYEFIRVLKPGGYVLVNMRTHHFEDRGYPNALIDLSEQCKIVRREIFPAFPDNPEFKHEYQFILIKKFS